MSINRFGLHLRIVFQQASVECTLTFQREKEADFQCVMVGCENVKVWRVDSEKRVYI